MSHQSPHGIRVSGFQIDLSFPSIGFFIQPQSIWYQKNVLQYRHGNVFGLTWYLIYGNVFGLESNELAKL